MLATPRAENRFLQLSLTLVAAALLAACGPELTVVTTDSGEPNLGSAIARLQSDNGLSTNGLSANGLSANGLSANGLSANGFGTAAFRSWFNGNPVLSDLVMKYVSKCAAAPGTSYSWKNPSTGVTYTWPGSLGLAPGFAAGGAPTVAEQQLISACLAVMVNRYGASVSISVWGRTATGAQLSYRQWEPNTYYVKEGCFFGNVFTGQGVFAGRDNPTWTSSSSSLRACALTTQAVGPSSACSPLFFAGSCASICTLDATQMFYESCTYNGVTYKPLNTRLQAADVYTCGDGTCQVSEHCGTGTTADSCKADCGVCP